LPSKKEVGFFSPLEIAGGCQKGSGHKKFFLNGGGEGGGK